jgi:hypothetical protein
MRTLSLAAAALLFAAAAKATAPSAAIEDDVDFKKDVWPIFEARCMTCHGSMDMGKFRLDSKERIMKGGMRGVAVVVGNPDESPLYQRVVLPADDFDIMPAEGEPLTEEQQETLRLWIENGADFGDWTAAE